jgi:hypothetical protein
MVASSRAFASPPRQGLIGAAAPVRENRVQPFGSGISALARRHERTTAVAITDSADGVGEGSKMDRSFAEKTAAGSYGSITARRTVVVNDSSRLKANCCWLGDISRPDGRRLSFPLEGRRKDFFLPD